MTDSMTSRVARVISGSVHALLDAVETAAPEAVMAQAIREVEQVLAEVRAELGKVEAGKHLIRTRLNRLNTENEEIAERVDLALAQNREDLARAGLAQQLNIEDQVPVLQKSLVEQGEAGRELESSIAALLAKKREMEQALRDYLASRTEPASASPSKVSSDMRVEDASRAFGRILARQSGIAEVPSAASVDAAKLQELADLQRQHRIDERLARLRALHHAEG